MRKSTEHVEEQGPAVRTPAFAGIAESPSTFTTCCYPLEGNTHTHQGKHNISEPTMETLKGSEITKRQEWAQ